LRRAGVLGESDPFRKIGFLVGLSMIMGAAAVDIVVIGRAAIGRVAARRHAPAPASQGGGLSTGRLLAWVAFWGAALVVISTVLLGEPVGYVLIAIALVFVFVFVNGISAGISDSNPISSAFVVSVLLMSTLGLRDPIVAMMAASILLVSATVGVDMQQDRSTGWRLGSSRAIQFRYQAIGIFAGAVLCVALTKLFLKQYPALKIDTFTNPKADVGMWHSAMTFKFVAAIRTLGHMAPAQMHAIWLGLGIGLGTEVARKLLASSRSFRAFTTGGRLGFAAGWVVDAVVLPSPYAASFGGFLEFAPIAWFAAGSVFTSLLTPRAPAKTPPEQKADELPADMSTASLIGGGLIAGESLYTLGAGITALLALL
jgi:uncharacterized oligopeptide transporter (OPT) family protein